MIRLLPILLLAACASKPVVAPATARLPNVPVELQDCMGPASAPAAPKPPRTIEAVVRWAGKVNAALTDSERARSDCAIRLHRLNKWIEAQ